MNNVHLWLVLGASLLTACSSSSTPAPVTPGEDAGLDAPPPPMSEGGPLADGSTNDVPSSDVVTDGKPPPSDSGAGDGSTCVPTAGGATMTGECDLVQLAILQSMGGAATVVVGGRVGIGGSPMMAPCSLIDSIDIVSQGGTTLQTLQGTSLAVATDGSGGPWTTGTASPALTQMCGSDTSRFDGIGLVVHGRTDGGTFVTKCGDNTLDVGWPPRVVVTCHRGLAAPPLGTNATVQTFGMMALDQLFAAVPEPPTITSVDANVHVIPGTAGIWGAMPMMPFDTTGWTSAETTMTEPDGKTATNVTLANMTDVLGVELCPVPPPMPNPMQPPPPVFLARITGATSAGPFMSELYVDFCARM
jgi:hypothetical protein